MIRNQSVSNRGETSPVIVMFIAVFILAVIVSIVGMMFFGGAEITSPDESANAVYNEDTNQITITTNQEYAVLQYKVDSNEWQDINIEETMRDNSSTQVSTHIVEIEPQPETTLTVRGKPTTNSEWKTITQVRID